MLNNFFVKDLSSLNRPLTRILIVDNIADNFSQQPDNGIFIRTWFDDESDNALKELAPLLQEIVEKKVKDVRNALRFYREQMVR